jgi:hypothetical protein
MVARAPTIAERPTPAGRIGAKPAMGNDSLLGRTAKTRDFLKDAAE